MAKTRYARKVSKRKGATKRNGATKRKGATKRRANTKRRGMKNKRRGGSLRGSFMRGVKRLGNFSAIGVNNAASGVGSAARSAASGVGSAANSAKGKATDVAIIAASRARAARDNVRAAAEKSTCIGVDDELAEAENKLRKVKERITRLEGKQALCDVEI